jgi:hypothetical protein
VEMGGYMNENEHKINDLRGNRNRVDGQERR